MRPTVKTTWPIFTVITVRDESYSRLVILFALYFLQGLPYGFQVKFLPLLLRNRNFSLSSIGLSRLLSLPWLLKAAIAPFVDGFGFLHKWITICLSGTAAFYAIPAFTGAKHTGLILSCVFGLNVLAAIQDIAVDSLAMRLLSTQDLGKVNAAQVVGYKVGVLFGGGVLLWLTGYISWGISFLVLSGIYVMSAVCSNMLKNLNTCDTYDNKKNSDKEPTLCLNNKDSSLVNGAINVNCIQETSDSIRSKQHQQRKKQDGENTIETSRQDVVLLQHQKADSSFTRTLTETLSEYTNVYHIIWHTPGFRWLAFYTLFYKLGEQGLVSMFPLFLLDNGYSVSATGIVSGMFGQVCSIAGSAIGGWFMNINARFGTYEVLTGALVFRLFPMVAQLLLAVHGTNFIAVLISECFLQFFAGVVTVATFTLMMHSSKLSSPKCQATHFSTLATIEVLGKLMMISFSGMVVDRIGYVTFFAFCTVLSLVVLLIIKVLPRNAAFTEKEL